MSDDDLKKLMAKMNDSKNPTEKPIEKPAPAPIEQPAPVENAPQPTEIPDDIDDEDVESVEGVEQEQPVTEKVEQVPTKQEDVQHPIEQEVAVLQNVGIYRREIVLIEKEKVDVLK